MEKYRAFADSGTGLNPFVHPTSALGISFNSVLLFPFAIVKLALFWFLVALWTVADIILRILFGLIPPLAAFARALVARIVASLLLTLCGVHSYRVGLSPIGRLQRSPPASARALFVTNFVSFLDVLNLTAHHGVSAFLVAPNTDPVPSDSMPVPLVSFSPLAALRYALKPRQLPAAAGLPLACLLPSYGAAAVLPSSVPDNGLGLLAWPSFVRATDTELFAGDRPRWAVRLLVTSYANNRVVVPQAAEAGTLRLLLRLMTCFFVRATATPVPCAPPPSAEAASAAAAAAEADVDREDEAGFTHADYILRWANSLRALASFSLPGSPPLLSLSPSARWDYLAFRRQRGKGNGQTKQE
jgi:hypothetical protein